MLENPWVRNGQYIVADDSDMRGPYGDSDAPHRRHRSSWLLDSRMCGTCHDLFNPGIPRRDLDGGVMDHDFPEQTTYSEWARSAFAEEGKTCQNCHMVENPGPIAKDAAPRTDRSEHGFVGANLWLLEAIAFLDPELGLSGALTRGRARTLASLRSAADLEGVSVPEVLERGQSARLVFRVVNNSGHKLPTGYPEGRRVWVSAEVSALGLDRGRFDDVTGEPSDPLAMYHAVQGQYETGPGHHVALNDTVFEDTRLLPRGYRPDPITDPVGRDFERLEDGTMAHWDTLGLDLEIPCDFEGDSVEAEVRLWYQSVTASYVETLLSAAAGTEAAERLGAAYAAIGAPPAEIGRTRFSVPVSATPCVLSDAGVSDAGTMVEADAGRAVDPEPHQPDDVGCACSSQSLTGGGLSGLFLCLLGLLLVRRKALVDL